MRFYPRWMTATIVEERRTRLDRLRGRLTELRDEALAAEKALAAEIASVDPSHRESAANVVHYCALRAHDLRELQTQLSDEGLSSLGRMESGVLRNLDAVIRIVDDALGNDEPVVDQAEWNSGRDILTASTLALLGPKPSGRNTRVMVTMPSQAAVDGELVARCAAAGMDLARINCAHDDPTAWRAMAAHVRAVRPETKIAMDLAGPKLRTGPIAPGPEVLKVRPTRSALGEVLVPARFWAGRAPLRSDVLDAVGVVDEGWLAGLGLGDTVGLVDARGRRRILTVLQIASAAVLLGTDRTMYLTPGLTLRADGGSSTRIGPMPPLPQALRVFRGDSIVLTTDLTPAEPTDDGHHRLGCSLPEALAAMREGHRVFFDDGKIEGVVSSVAEDSSQARVEVVRAALNGTKLRAEKGINLPDTYLPLPALTDDDVTDLDSVVEIADLVNVSFVRSRDDVAHAQRELAARNAAELGLVVKIETVAAVDALPEILLQLMRNRRVGVMIARGDLAVEAGFERLAEVQEEILWLCEAAHVPVIWATEVLDSLADRGLPTRAEITDAAAGNRAECVMLNKGPHIVEAIEALVVILTRMRRHIEKKRPLLRRMSAWDLEE